MAQDVSMRYGPTKVTDPPLSETEQARLRALGRKSRLRPLEEYELGALRGRARHDPAGKRLLADLSHDQASRQQAPLTVRQAGDAIARTVADQVARRLAEED